MYQWQWILGCLQNVSITCSIHLYVYGLLTTSEDKISFNSCFSNSTLYPRAYFLHQLIALHVLCQRQSDIQSEPETETFRVKHTLKIFQKLDIKDIFSWLEFLQFYWKTGAITYVQWPNLIWRQENNWNITHSGNGTKSLPSIYSSTLTLSMRKKVSISTEFRVHPLVCIQSLQTLEFVSGLLSSSSNLQSFKSRVIKLLLSSHNTPTVWQHSGFGFRSVVLHK